MRSYLSDARLPTGRTAWRYGATLDTVGAHDHALLEGRVRGTGLQRHHVPPTHLPHHPHVGGICDERLADPVPLNLAVAVLEDDEVSFTQLVELVEDEPAPGTVIAEAVAGEVHVPLGGVGPR